MYIDTMRVVLYNNPAYLRQRRSSAVLFTPGHRQTLQPCTAVAQAKARAEGSKGFGKSVKPKKVKKTTKPTQQEHKERWSFEQLMVCWDDLFRAACEDSEWAAEIFEKARTGHSKYGRGCVLVQAQLQSRFKGGARGSKVARQRSEASADPPPDGALPTNPDLLVEGWGAVYLPAELLLPLGGVLTEDDAVDLSETSRTAAPTKSAAQDYGISGALVSKLQRAMRAMDNTRLLTLTGLLPDGVPSSGEQAYDPAEDELVVLLSARIDGWPSIGADIVAVEVQQDGTVRLVMPGLEMPAE